MRIVVVQTGRLRDPHAVALRDEFVKRFARFGKLSVIEREPKGDKLLWPESARWKVALDERGDVALLHRTRPHDDHALRGQRQLLRHHCWFE